MQTEYWKNLDNAHYYVAAPIKDLLGYYTVAVANGGEKIKHRRYKTVYAAKNLNETEIKAKFEEISKKRLQRKYTKVL